MMDAYRFSNSDQAPRRDPAALGLWHGVAIETSRDNRVTCAGMKLEPGRPRPARPRLGGGGRPSPKEWRAEAEGTIG